jgi:hypothetical protein
MRVAHEHQKKSALTWMGCRESFEIDPDRRQYLKNARLDEELEDLDENDDEEDHYFEIDERSQSSDCNRISLNTSWTICLATFYLSSRLF